MEGVLKWQVLTTWGQTSGGRRKKQEPLWGWQEAALHRSNWCLEGTVGEGLRLNEVASDGLQMPK